MAVQGFGNVGYWFAKIAQEEGFKIIAISDSKGGIVGEIGERYKVDLRKAAYILAVDKVTKAMLK